MIAGVGLAVLAVVAAIVVVLVTHNHGQQVAVRQVPSTLAPTTTSSTTTSTVPAATFPTLYQEDASGVVRIDATTCGGTGVGTGFLLGPNLVATAAHVVEGAVAIGLTAGGSTTVGQVVGIDAATDVALVRSSTPLAGHVFTVSTVLPRVGTEVGAIGFPEGGPVSFTRGSVSGVDRTIEVRGRTRTGMIQTDTAINPGNSGGPLLLVSGDVIGLVDAGNTQANGIGFAVPGALAAPLLSSWQAAPAPPARPSCQNALGPSSSGPIHTNEGGADVQGIVATLTTYFNAIDGGDYPTAYAQLAPAEQQRFTPEGFAANLATTYDFDVAIGAVSQRSPGTDLVDVTFTSLQSPSKGPDGGSCDHWTLEYTMIQVGGSWLIQYSIGQGGSTHTSCF